MSAIGHFFLEMEHHSIARAHAKDFLAARIELSNMMKVIEAVKEWRKLAGNFTKTYGSKEINAIVRAYDEYEKGVK